MVNKRYQVCNWRKANMMEMASFVRIWLMRLNKQWISPVISQSLSRKQNRWFASLLKTKHQDQNQLLKAEECEWLACSLVFFSFFFFEILPGLDLVSPFHTSLGLYLSGDHCASEWGLQALQHLSVWMAKTRDRISGLVARKLPLGDSLTHTRSV